MIHVCPTPWHRYKRHGYDLTEESTNLLCIKMSADFWAGYLSGAVGILIGNPLDLLKVRLQASEAIVAPEGRPLRAQFDSAGSLIRGSICSVMMA